MAVVSRTATLRMDDTATHATNVLQWVAQAVTQDTAAGGSVDVTVTRTVVGAPPGDPNTLQLEFRNKSGTQIRLVTLDSTSPSQLVTFHFTTSGLSGGTARAGTVEIVLRATRTAIGTYDVETDGSPNTPPALFDSHLDRGFLRGTTSATMALSNVALGGAKNSPASNDDGLFVRTTLGATLYVAESWTVGVSGATPALSGSTNSASSGNWDVSFATSVDNRFVTSSQTVTTSLTEPTGSLAGGETTGVATVGLTTTTDSMTLDPRLTLEPHAEKDNTRSASQETAYVISADQLFVWTLVTNARGEARSGITVTQRVKNGASTVFTNSSAVTGADGWTTTEVDATAAVAAPAGNRTQESLPAAPSDTVGLGTGTQTLGFSSAFTANREVVVQVDDEVAVGQATTIRAHLAQMLASGAREVLPLDETPKVRLVTINSDGTETTDLALVNMVSIGADGWQAAWTPSTNGVYVCEVRAKREGAFYMRATPVMVKARTVFDPTGLFS